MATTDNIDEFIDALREGLDDFADSRNEDARALAKKHFQPTIRRSLQILTRETKREDWTNRVTGKSGKGWLGGSRTDSRGIFGNDSERPSIRHQKAGRGSGPIYLNWGFEFGDEGSGSFSIINRSTHLQALLEGTPRHQIPLRRRKDKHLKFWRGRPLKWNAKSNEFNGWNIREQIDHRGIQAMEKGYLNLFEEAYEEALKDARYEKAVDDYFKERILDLRNSIISRLNNG